jgi:thiol-disulfide isomerase/thioredoxin
MEKNWVDGQLAKLAPEAKWQPNVSRALARFKERRSGGTRWLWMAAAFAASCVCLLAFPAPRAVCVNACTVLFQKKAARQPAVDFTVKDASGADLRLSDYKGKVVLLNFWATYCVPCRTEIPRFIEFEKTYRDKGFAVVGISMDEEWEAVKPYLAEKKVNYRIGLGNDVLAQKYGGLDALPETFLIDREGRVVSRHVGMVSKADCEKDIVQVLGK